MIFVSSKCNSLCVVECYFLYIKNLKETRDIMKRHLGDSYLFINSVEHISDIMKRHLGDSYLFINSVEHTGVLLGRIIHVTLQYFFFSQSESVYGFFNYHLYISVFLLKFQYRSTAGWGPFHTHFRV